jgi:ubiquinone/menaquinone biosynthesis C-methylase UbiE
MKGFFEREFMKMYPNIPSHALWRAVEANLLSSLPYEYPLLDLGGGDGNFAKLLFPPGFGEIHACDKSAIEVATARSKSVYKSAVVAHAEHLPYRDCCFATVLSNCVLEHIPEDKAVLREVSRVLRQGGRFIFTVPSDNFEGNLRNQGKKYIDKINRRLEHFHYRSPGEWEALLKQHGLKLDSFRYYFPRRIQQRWELLMRFSIVKIMGKEINQLLGSRKFGLCFLARRVSPVVLNLLLRKFVSQGTAEDKDGGALLIQCHKEGRAI